MNWAGEIDAARLSVLLDVRQPHAYLALHPAIAFAESMSIEIRWFPLSVPTLKGPTPAGTNDDRGTRHVRYRAQAREHEIATYARAQGLEMHDYYRSGDAHAANLAWLWVRERQPDRLHAVLAELFRGYWSLELDVASQEQVAALLDSLAADGTGFLEWSVGEGPQAASSLAEELQGRGLFQTPAYLVEGEVFYGRQHLPMIRWILEGRSGAIPI